jgi:hypothetical protein
MTSVFGVPGHTETVVGKTVIRSAAVPERHQAEVSAVAVTPSANAPIGRLCLMDIPTPLPHVSAHVVEAQFVGRLLPGRPGSSTIRIIAGRVPGIAGVPTDEACIIAPAITKPLAERAAAGGEFPFHLSRQTITVCRHVPRWVVLTGPVDGAG